MGPGKDNGKTRGIMDPPVFEPDKDLQAYRQELATWVDLIKTAAEKGSQKTVYAKFSRQLYDRGLHRAQKSVVDEVQDRGEIDCKQEDQVRAVQEIVNLIAVDPLIAVVSRLINSFNKVTNCQRKNNEDLNRFVSRFRGFAADHLLRDGATSASQIGEVLAIILLNNAILPEATLTQAKLILIALAEARNKDAVEESFSVQADDITIILETSARIAKLASVIKVYKKDVIRSLADTTKKGDVEEAMTKNQMQTAVSKEVHSFFTNHHVMNTVKKTGTSSKNLSNKNTKTLPLTTEQTKTSKKRKRDIESDRPRGTLAQLIGNACRDCVPRFQGRRWMRQPQFRHEEDPRGQVVRRQVWY